MQCDECKEKPATVHLTKIINQEKTEAHLCEDCARKKSDQFLIEPSFTFHNILAGLFEPEETSTVGVGRGRARKVGPRVRCENCGLSFADFRRLGHLGCSRCYDQFEAQLDPVLRRIHGATRHAGKVPIRAGAELKAKRDLRRLREELQEAIAKEEYERAAQLRDKIREAERAMDT